MSYEALLNFKFVRHGFNKEIGDIYKNKIITTRKNFDDNIICIVENILKR